MVAATGTGKTVIAGDFDWDEAGTPAKLLFVAHREELSPRA